MSEAWSVAEEEAIVSDYFAMLLMELRGIPYNKAAHNTRLRSLLSNRSRGSVERKHQNISAVLIKAGFPYIPGYKPLSNVQGILRDVVFERLHNAGELHLAAESFVQPQGLPDNLPLDLLGMNVPVPIPDRGSSEYVQEPSAVYGISHKKNYLELEARNQLLGEAGEKLILQFEHRRLWEAGQRRLADQVEHVSQTKGDSLGYDIGSFETDGRERLIEVKTTRLGALTPFFVSRNEVEVSERRQEVYHVYRLFTFSKDPRFFSLAGSLRTACELSCVSYSAVVR